MATTTRDPEASEPTPKERAAREAVTSLIRTADRVTRSLERTFARFDLTGPQYNVLRILRGAGRPLPTMKVAERMLQKTPAVTGILDRLQGKGLVRRKRSSEDRRVWNCSITDEGLALLAEMELPVREANVAAVGSATRQELETLAELLERLEDGAEEDGG